MQFLTQLPDIPSLLATIDDWIWGPPLLLLLTGTGLFFTVRLGFIQLRRLPFALKQIFKPADASTQGDVSGFAALCTALSATIGTGNIIGVATAIALGGPGALFWMWLAAFLGMATKYAECLLAVKYRETDHKGNMLGGPMMYLSKGAGQPLLAKLFALFGLGVACFGIGTFPQVNAISSAATHLFNIPTVAVAGILTALVALVTIGGVKSISAVAAKIVPVMAVFYVVACLWVLGANIEQLPHAVALVFESAFTGMAATGGFAGAGMMLAIQAGIARGVFSNESGLGSAPIAAAAAKTDSCVEQGLVSMTGTFIDTLVICTMTGLTLILTQSWSGELAGAAMTSHAFAVGMESSIGPMLVNIGLLFFAFTTILGWHYYGERCVAYLFGKRAIYLYKLIFIGLIASGSFIHLNTIWILADIVNGLMAIPNLIGLLLLRHVVINETRAYFNQEAASPARAEHTTCSQVH
ncbi:MULTISPECIES: sodium:alanine symporter family protein [unclassified Salinivibrio]|uniref:alanine/glycine:cation symporter family protein n=1 Tax=unclassified Salinivibrio TaxID=2636825 RepID=UPI0009899B62|nr:MULTISPECIES: sodium:alanine symporter family protein [unclassified Salinivibrio]OOF24660.1 sodium:alanine symporter family protein [Salinivibrio sp. IB574]PCE67297.1 sodium:alanine symporter family protein [Salinivibrio sp. YCSC6]QCF35799.1 sodium:alanine symporter family protein [Salinivibrio sp. YCSC6]